MEEEDLIPNGCPLDGRRSPTEIWVKLFVIHFTAITAFCHLLSIRKERILSPKLLAFVLVPLNQIASIVMGLLVIGVAAIYWTCCGDDDRSEKLQHAFLVLFGRNEEDNKGYASLRQRKESGADEEAPLTKMGRIVLVLAFMVQCTGVIVIYSRRVAHGADTLGDRVALDFACGGLLTALLTIACVVEVPVCAKPAPTIDEDHMSLMESILVYCAREDVGFQSPALGLIIAGGRCFFLIVLLSRFSSLEVFLNLDLLFNTITSDSGGWKDTFIAGGGCLLLATLAIFLLSIVYSMVSLTIKSVMSMPTTVKAAFEPCLSAPRRPWVLPVVFWVPLMSVIILFGIMYFVFGFLWVVIWYIENLGAIKAQTSALTTWPTDRPCPPDFWTDPLSNWLWMLA